MSEPVNLTADPPSGNGTTPPGSDQEHFDEVVDRDSKIVLGVLAGIAVLAALIMSTVALVKSSDAGHTVTVTKTVAAATTAAKSSAPLQVISFSVDGSVKRGPDGKMHDAYSQTEFAVKAGVPVELKIDNKDESPHSITSPEAGVNIMVVPGIHTYTMDVKKPGRFEWKCIIPCDSEANGWAMKHAGYMAGYITAS
jgi:heme/copper-type cytochrome/quinol oxidase subunit 2